MNVCYCTYSKNNKPVQSGLALTPAQVMLNAEAGIPIKTLTQSDEYFDEGSTEQSYDVPIHHQRGVDINDCWERSRTTRKYMHKVAKSNNVEFNIE